MHHLSHQAQTRLSFCVHIRDDSPGCVWTHSHLTQQLALPLNCSYLKQIDSQPLSLWVNHKNLGPWSARRDKYHELSFLLRNFPATIHLPVTDLHLNAMPAPLGTSSSPCLYQNSLLYNVLLLISYCNDGPPKRYYNLILMLATHIPEVTWSRFECLATSLPLQLFTEYLQTWQWFLMFIASIWYLFLIYGKKHPLCVMDSLNDYGNCLMTATFIDCCKKYHKVRSSHVVTHLISTVT